VMVFVSVRHGLALWVNSKGLSRIVQLAHETGRG